jgi:hypothetical protein
MRIEIILSSPFATCIHAFLNCSIFSAAVPFFPSTMVAACPNLTPGILSSLVDKNFVDNIFQN